MNEWQRIDFSNTEVRIDWWDCTVGIGCACNPLKELVVLDERERTCHACGRKYRLVAYLEMQEASDVTPV